MSLKLAGRLFTGPLPCDSTEIRANQTPVVYAIIAKGGKPWEPVFRVVDVGASPDEGIRFASHPDRSDWLLQSGETLGVYLLNVPRSAYTVADRVRLALEFRRQHDTPRGMI